MDDRRAMVFPFFGSPGEDASTTASLTTTSTEPGPLMPKEELLAVCCHHVTKLGVLPDLTWGTAASLQEQAFFLRWGCDGVLQRHFGTLENTSENCLSLGPQTYTF